jgi:hypothetical protein
MRAVTIDVGGGGADRMSVDARKIAPVKSTSQSDLSKDRAACLTRSTQPDRHTNNVESTNPRRPPERAHNMLTASFRIQENPRECSVLDPQ